MWAEPMVAMGLSVVAIATPAPHEAVVVGVAVQCQAAIPGSALIRAYQEASEMYRDVAVRFIWRDRAPDPDELADIELKIIILGRPVPERPSPPGEMGVGNGTSTGRGRLAFIFYDRVSKAAVTHRTTVDKMLGLVIAHELGHLLLPDGRHAPDGVMRAEWGFRDFEALRRGRLRVSDEEGLRIRARFGKQ